MATDREKEVIRAILQKADSPCIVELGARTGEEEDWLREACGNGAGRDPHYLMVEPDPWNAQQILDHPRGIDQNRKLILGAVADMDGDAPFYLSESADGSHTSGSIRRPTGHYEKYPDVKFTGLTRVPSWTLDTLFAKEWLEKIDLLWVDIQGAEGDMILGGRQALERTRYLFMEVELNPLYHGQATRDELLALLPDWELIEDFGDNVLLRNPSPIEGRL